MPGDRITEIQEMSSIFGKWYMILVCRHELRKHSEGPGELAALIPSLSLAVAFKRFWGFPYLKDGILRRRQVFSFLSRICDFKYFQLLQFLFFPGSLLSFPFTTSPQTVLVLQMCLASGGTAAVLLLVHTANSRASWRASHAILVFG